MGKKSIATAGAALLGLTLAGGCNNQSVGPDAGAPNLDAALRSGDLAKDTWDAGDPVVRAEVKRVMEAEKLYRVQVTSANQTNKEAEEGSHWWNLYLWDNFRSVPAPEMPADLAAWQCSSEVQNTVSTIKANLCDGASSTIALCNPIAEAAPLCLPSGKHLKDGRIDLSLALVDGFPRPIVSTEVVNGFSPELTQDLLVTAYFDPKTGTAGSRDTYAFGVNPTLVKEQIKNAGPDAQTAMLRLRGKSTEAASAEATDSLATKEITEQIPHEGEMTVKKSAQPNEYLLNGDGILLSQGEKEFFRYIDLPVVLNGEGKWQVKEGTYKIKKQTEGEEDTFFYVTISENGNEETSLRISEEEYNKIKESIGADGAGKIIIHSDVSVDWTGNIRTARGDTINGPFPVSKKNGKWEVFLGGEKTILLKEGGAITCILEDNGKTNYASRAIWKGEGEDGREKVLTVVEKGNHWIYSGDSSGQKYTFSLKNGLDITR